MIHSEDYTHDLCTILPEGNTVNFSVIHDTIPKGVKIRTYSPSGMVYFDELRKDFPFVKLQKGSDTLMSDTPFEQESMRMSVTLSHGNVLMIGLGLGLFPVMVKQHGNRVKSLTIVEREADVFALVFPYLKGHIHPRTSYQLDDGWDYMVSTDKKYDFVFIDIWGVQMAAVREGPEWAERAKMCLAPGGEVRFWMQEIHARVARALENIRPGEGAGFDMRTPCFMCAKTLRNDFGGLCMDCADQLGVSEMFMKRGD